MKFGVAVGLRINNLLKERNITVYKFALDLGMYSQNIYTLINGKTEDVKMSTACRFAGGFNMTISEFLDDKLFSSENLEILQ